MTATAEFASSALGHLTAVNGLSMKTEPDTDADDLRPEYDIKEFLRTAVRGKYAGRVGEGGIMVEIDPELLEAFPDADSVNEALRLVIEAGRLTQKASGS